MKLNVEEQNFVHRWSWNYPSALKASRAFHDRPRPEHEPSATADYVLEMSEEANNLYASYRYWYGLIFGMIQAMSFKIRISIYGACLKALKHLEEEAIGNEKDI